MSYDSLKGTFSIESNDVGGRNAINFSDPDGFLMNSLGLANEVSAKDAIITLNGVSTTRETNDFTIEDMKISLTDESVGKEYTIQVTKDTTKTTDTIKKFVEEYNKLVDSLQKSYGTSRPKSDKYSYYEPLTDEEKDALSETELEKYETKAKEGLLYRDSILSGISSSMRTMLYEPLQLENGKTISLYEIGITTSKDYRQGGKLEINEEKLTAALEEYGEEVVDLFTKASDITYGDKANRSERRKTEGIAYRIEDIIKDAISTNGTIYNKAGILETASVTTNDLYKTISAQDQRISDMLKMLTTKEDNYYAMFSKLETAMTQANNQMSSLQGLLGA
jgi:flagellar hook-associated protein 2